MHVHVLLNLLNVLRKRDKLCGCAECNNKRITRVMR